MNTKHTPAPWTVNPKAKTNIRHGNLTIANCSSTHDGSREEEEIANAKLIAASPELLKALEELMKVYERNGQLLSFDVNIARNAIKKATE
jgi:hypothetical protein